MDDFGTLAAIVYQPGFRIDEFLVNLAHRLRADGARIGGVVQRNTRVEDGRPAMTLIDLSSNKQFHISLDLGTEARGCRLDLHGLADAESALAATMNADRDLILLNKFGRAEAEGSGLRTAFVRAIESEIPVLTAVRAPYTEAWKHFHGGLAVTLPPDLEAVQAWCRSAIEPRARRSIPGRLTPREA
jgi:nucleoside-triphosphatase THEP1